MEVTVRDLSKIIKEKCLDCCGGNRTQAKECTQLACPLWGATDWHHKRKTKKELRDDGKQLRITIEIK